MRCCRYRDRSTPISFVRRTRTELSGPMLALVSGHLPSGSSEVVVTTSVASAFHLRVGVTWQAGGIQRRVVGIVENPNSLLDRFAR